MNEWKTGYFQLDKTNRLLPLWILQTKWGGLYKTINLRKHSVKSSNLMEKLKIKKKLSTSFAGDGFAGV